MYAAHEVPKCFCLSACRLELVALGDLLLKEKMFLLTKPNRTEGCQASLR